MNMNNAMNEYQHAGARAEVMDASPHRLIQMLMEGALERISIAKGAMQHHDIAAKGERIGSAITIIEGLRTSLDKEKGGDVAMNLDALYEYMSARLLEANVKDDVEMLDEVAELIKKIKAGWDGVPEEFKQ